VFTEKNPDTDQMERFVYVQHGDTFDKRNVKVGVADYFFAEIQEGLAPGEIVSLELPKEELDRKSRMIAGQSPRGEPVTRPKASVSSNTGATNTATLGTAAPAPVVPAKVLAPAVPAVVRGAAAGKSS